MKMASHNTLKLIFVALALIFLPCVVFSNPEEEAMISPAGLNLVPGATLFKYCQAIGVMAQKGFIVELTVTNARLGKFAVVAKAYPTVDEDLRSLYTTTAMQPHDVDVLEAKRYATLLSTLTEGKFYFYQLYFKRDSAHVQSRTAPINWAVSNFHLPGLMKPYVTAILQTVTTKSKDNSYHKTKLEGLDFNQFRKVFFETIQSSQEALLNRKKEAEDMEQNRAIMRKINVDKEREVRQKQNQAADTNMQFLAQDGTALDNKAAGAAIQSSLDAGKFVLLRPDGAVGLRKAKKLYVEVAGDGFPHSKTVYNRYSANDNVSGEEKQRFNQLLDVLKEAGRTSPGVNFMAFTTIIKQKGPHTMTRAHVMLNWSVGVSPVKRQFNAIYHVLSQVLQFNNALPDGVFYFEAQSEDEVTYEAVMAKAFKFV